MEDVSHPVVRQKSLEGGWRKNPSSSIKELSIHRFSGGYFIQKKQTI